MTKFKVVPISEDVSEQEAMQEFNEQFTKISDLPKNLNSFPKEVVSALGGKLLGEVDGKIKKLADAFEVEFDEEMKMKEKIELLTNTIQEKVKSIESQIGSGNEELQKTLESLRSENEGLKGLKKDLQAKLKEKENEVENIKVEFGTKAKQAQIQAKKNEILRSMPLVDSQVHLKAMNLDLSSYEFDFDEDGKEIVKKDGQPLQSKKAAGEFANFVEVIEEVATINDAIKKTTAQVNGSYTPPAPESIIRKSRA